MGRFAKPANQAARAVRELTDLSPRHGKEDDGKFHSLGSVRIAEQVVTQFIEWRLEHGDNRGIDMDRETCMAYLADRSAEVEQTTLDQDRQVLQKVLQEKLDMVRSEKNQVLTSRAYTLPQISIVAAAQAEHNAIATLIASNAGLRAHELATIRPVSEQPPSGHRTWAQDRFSGREDNVRYSVVGKGGLVREVAIDRNLAERLEDRRLDSPRTVMDRGIRYQSHYNIGRGMAWSKSFGEASRRALDWSNGGHGLRHGYAQRRMDALLGRGCDYLAAKLLVSQELGHFRPGIVEVYLR